MPWHDKTNKMSVHPVKTQISLGIHPFHCVLNGYLRTQAFFMQTVKTLIRLGGCPGWSESSMGAQPFCCFYTALFGSDDISLRVISDWPFNEPIESLLPKSWPEAHGAKHKMTSDVTDVTLSKHSERLAPFSCLYHLKRIRKCMNLKGISSWKYWESQVSQICLHVMYFMWYRIGQYLYFSKISFCVGKKKATKLSSQSKCNLKKYRTAKCYVWFHLLNEELHAHEYSLNEYSWANRTKVNLS